MRPDPAQFDFFEEPHFPNRIRNEAIDVARFRATLKRAMAQAIRECAFDRPTIAARMAQYLRVPSISKAMLDAYTAESKESHDITIPRFKAFVHATGAVWLWDTIVSEDGLLLLQGDEAQLAEIGRLRQEQREIASKLKALQARPVEIKRKAKR